MTQRGTPASGTSEPDAPPRATVLVVDDEPANVSLLQRILRDAGVGEVHGLSDPRLAVSTCLEIGADLLLLDLHMPFLDGLEVLEQLTAALAPDTYMPVVVLTADMTRESRDRVLEAGATDFLTKPFDRTEVILRVRNLLQTRALYLEVTRRNAELQAELEERLKAERRAEKERQRRLERVDAVLRGDALTMVFQPVAELRGGAVVGAEALARFSHVPYQAPNVWFEEAAAVGRGEDLELAAVSQALAQLEYLARDAFLSVNVSPEVAGTSAFARLLSDVPSNRLVVELTEHSRVEEDPGLMAALRSLRADGVRLAVDDAGAGYAGLQQILRLKPDILKLDIALTRGLDADPARRALTTAMVTFAAEIEAVVIAEGVETAAELETLRALGVPWGQGFHLARPAAHPPR